MRLKEISICGFRGFNDKKTISLNNKVVLIYGLNGSGKSSLVEALEWLFWGEISRKERSSCKSEYMANYLKNIHYDSKENPFVEVTANLKGEELKIKKELIGITGFKYYINDKEIEDISSLNINLEKSAKPILSQGEIKSFVDTEPKDKWVEISKILGIEIFGRFRGDLQELSNKFENNSDYNKAKMENNSVLSSIKQYLPEFSSIAEREFFNYKKIISILLNEIGEMVSSQFKDIGEAKTALNQKQGEILKKVKKPKGIKFLDIYSPLEEIELDNIIKLCYRIKLNIAKLKEVDKKYLKFLELGLDLLQPPKCPFCGEDTLTEEKRKSLSKKKEENEKILKSLKDLDNDIATLKSKRDILLKVNSFIAQKSNLSKAIEELKEDEIYKSELQKLSEVIKKYSKVETIKSDILSTHEYILDIFSKTVYEYQTYEEDALKNKISALDKNFKKLFKLLSGIVELVSEIRNNLVSKARDLTPKEREEYQSINNILTLLKKINYFKIAVTYRNKIDLINDTITKLEQFEKIKAKELLEKLSKDIQYYYNKLNPQEPIQFKRITPTSGLRRQAKLEAESFGKEINPVTCFSEAHINSLGLSLYFPQRVDFNPKWEFIILDDPVQSMDDDHANQLIDILKEKVKAKQVIILTHSNKLRKDIKSRIGKENLLEYEFVPGDETGPRIELKEGPMKILLKYAKYYCGGIIEERKMAGNNLRQATEKLLVKFLIKKGQNSTTVYRSKKDDLFKRSRNAGFNEDDLKDLDTVFKYADPASHGHDPKDIKKGDIVWGIGKVKQLTQKYIPEIWN